MLMTPDCVRFLDLLELTLLHREDCQYRSKLDNMAFGLSARPSSSNNCPHQFTIVTIMDRFSPTV